MIFLSSRLKLNRKLYRSHHVPQEWDKLATSKQHKSKRPPTLFTLYLVCRAEIQVKGKGKKNLPSRLKAFQSAGEIPLHQLLSCPQHNRTMSAVKSVSLAQMSEGALRIQCCSVSLFRILQQQQTHHWFSTPSKVSLVLFV